MEKTPAQLGFRMPAEWEKQEAIWLVWPHQKADWPGKFEPIPWVWTEIVRAIASKQVVKLLVRDAKEEQRAQEICDRAGVNTPNIQFFHIPTNRVWMRDAGPIFVKHKDGRKMMLDWRFNSWAKYSNHQKDNAIPERIEEYTEVPRIQPFHKKRRVVLEGGAIDVNGKGTLLTTEECLLSKVQERNPGFKRDDYEKVFADNLGISNTIWLSHGIVGDDTHGHVDDITRFVNATTVVTAVEKNRQDANHEILKENVRRLKKARDQRGKQLDIVELPMPSPVLFEEQQVPASYANFLITNEAVLVPVFNDVNDRIALNILAELFPKRQIFPIFARDLIWGLGTIHCLSQQEPA